MLLTYCESVNTENKLGSIFIEILAGEFNRKPKAVLMHKRTRSHIFTYIDTTDNTHTHTHMLWQKLLWWSAFHSMLCHFTACPKHIAPHSHSLSFSPMGFAIFQQERWFCDLIWCFWCTNGIWMGISGFWGSLPILSPHLPSSKAYKNGERRDGTGKYHFRFPYCCCWLAICYYEYIYGI